MAKDFSRIDEHIAKQKKDFKPACDIEKKVQKQLKPLFEKFHPASSQFKLFEKYRKKMAEKLKKAQTFHNDYNQLGKCLSDGVAMRSAIAELSEEEISEEDKKSEKRQRTFLYAVNYLLSVEAIGNLFVDYTILLLIGSGIDFHLEPDTNHRYTRHAKTLEDIESPFISMSIKLDFLSSNGLDFFSKWIDRGLRNKIAHLDFEIDQEGNFLAGKQKKKVDIELKSNIFWSYFSCVAKIYSDALKTARKAKKKKR